MFYLLFLLIRIWILYFKICGIVDPNPDLGAQKMRLQIHNTDPMLGLSPAGLGHTTCVCHCLEKKCWPLNIRRNIFLRLLCTTLK